MSKQNYVIDIIAQIIGGQGAKQSAELIVDRLRDEGLLHLGYGDVDIDKVVNTFTDTFGTTKVSKPDRWAANRLVKRYGAQTVVGIVKLLGQHSTERFAPVVNSVADLETKWVSVLNFLRNLKGEEDINV